MPISLLLSEMLLKLTEDEKSIIEDEIKGIKKIYIPEENKTEQNFSKLEFLSANLPPVRYPPLKPSRMTPIKLPQVYIESPKTGVNSLLPANSNAITSNPAINTSIRRKE